MKLIRQPNDYTCGAAALAMCLDMDIEDVINALGHDGSGIIDSSPHKNKKAGFSFSDVALACLRLGYFCTSIPVIPTYECGTKVQNWPDIDDLIYEIESRYNGPCLLVVDSETVIDGKHAVAIENISNLYSGGVFYDPMHDEPRPIEKMKPISYIEMFCKLPVF